MSYQFLEVDREGSITRLTINRPDRRNALHEALWHELRQVGLEFFDRPPRILIVTGTDDVFSAGMDIQPDNPLIGKLVPVVKNRDRTGARDIIRGLKAVFSAFARLNCPTISAIEGPCIGGGLELALATDFRVAARNATFSLPETRLGMVPDVGGMVRLSRLIGSARAKDLILTGRTADVDEAYRMGLVDRVAESGDALRAATEMAHQLLLGGPMATREALLALRKIAGTMDDTAFDVETEAGARALTSGEVLEAIAAFGEKRPPAWAE